MKKHITTLSLLMVSVLLFGFLAFRPVVAAESGTCTNGHQEVILYGEKAKWGQTGLTEGSYCSLCGTTIRPQSITQPITGYEMNEQEYDLLRLMNKERAAAGVVPFTTFDKLQNASGIRVVELSNGYLSSRPDGSVWYSVLQEVGISSYKSVGESLTRGYYPARQLVESLMKDDNHRASLLSTDRHHCSTGYTYNPSGSHRDYWHRFFYSYHNCNHTGMKVITPQYMSFYPGTSIDDMYMLVQFNCASCGTVYAPLISEYCKGYDPHKIGNQTVTVSCFDLTATFTVNILDHAHQYSHKVTPPTCTAVGYTIYTCPCGYSYRGDEKPVTQHPYDSGVVTTAPTCTKVGLKVYTCTGCGIQKSEDVPATGHKVVVDPRVEPTCTVNGLTQGSHCSICKIVLTPRETIGALGHDTVKDSAVAPTCSAPGKTEGSHCNRCKTVFVAQKPIDALPHTEVTDKAVVPTCTQDGKTAGSHCSVCGAVVKAQVPIPATGHKLVYTNLGRQHSAVCKYCSHTVTEAHSFKDGYCSCGSGPQVDASLKINHTLNLASDISVNFAVLSSLLEGYDGDSIFMEVKVPVYTNDQPTGSQITRILPVLNGNFYYFTLTGMTAVQMGDELQAVLYGVKDGMSYQSIVDVYSVAQYAYSQLNKSGMDASLKKLCAELLRYGSAAQTFKGYRVNALVDASMTASHKSYLSNLSAVTFGHTNEALSDLASPRVSWVGKALNLESKVTLKYVINTEAYTGELKNLNLRVSYKTLSGQPVTVIIKDLEEYNAELHQYAFSFDSLQAAELRSVLTAQVYEGTQPVSCSILYSPDTYGNNKTGTLETLCRSIFAYSDSAKAYFLG